MVYIRYLHALQVANSIIVSAGKLDLSCSDLLGQFMIMSQIGMGEFDHFLLIVEKLRLSDPNSQLNDLFHSRLIMAARQDK